MLALQLQEKSDWASTIYNELREKVGDHQIGVITEDCYYSDQSHLSMEERVKTNYDHPNALDHDSLCEHLQQLMSGNAFKVPEYSYTEHTRTLETRLQFTPKKVIILEGILPLTDPRLRNLMHARVHGYTTRHLVHYAVLSATRWRAPVAQWIQYVQYQETVRPMFM